ncbi:hypothetical protein VF13_40585 [Nostoc linckia z16]|nr:hypothetical protein VF13_40585 [Nostoc linckia z16]
MCLMSMAALEEIDPLDFAGKDKLLHATFYFVFTILWGLYSRSRHGSLRIKSVLLIFGCAVAYGIAVEVLQAVLTTNRSADILDAVANTAGSAIASLLLCIRYKKELISK